MIQLPIRTLTLAVAVALAAMGCNRAEETPSGSSSVSQSSSPGSSSSPGPLASSSSGPATSPPSAPVTTPPAGSTTPADTPTGSAASTDPAGSSAAGAAGRSGAETGSATTGVTGSAVPGGAAGVSGASAGPVSGSDRAFVSEAANNSLAEIEAGRLVSAKSNNPNIKALAQHMERDHATVTDELKRIAGDKGVNLPNTVAGEPRGHLSRLTTLSTGEMEQAFVRDFGIDAHQKAIALFERQAREGQDPDLKAFAERTLPKLREHLSMAQQLQSNQGRP